MTTQNTANEVIAAGAIIDIMSGGKLDWRTRIDQSDFLESADWQTALAYARAGLLVSSAEVGRLRERVADLSRMLDEASYADLRASGGLPEAGNPVFLREGGYFLTQGNKWNLRQLVGPLELSRDENWPWKASVYGLELFWRDDGKCKTSNVDDIVGDEVYAWPNHMPDDAQSVGMREALIASGCTASDGTYVHASMEDVLRALAAQPPAAPVETDIDALTGTADDQGLFADVSETVERDEVIEQIACRLAECYPDNANTNAFCAAIRSMKLEARSPHHNLSAESAGAELADRLASMPASDAIRGPHDWATIQSALRATQPLASSAGTAALRQAVQDYFELWDRCGGSTAIAAEAFADARQAMRDALTDAGPQALPVRPDSTYSQFHLDNWTDDDFAKHSAATRKTLAYLIELETALAITRPNRGSAE